MMGDIYRLTQEALIWIGKEEAVCDFTDYYITKMQNISSRPDRLGQVGLEELDVFLEENRLPFPSAFPMPVTASQDSRATGLSRAYEVLHMLADDRHLYELPFYQVGSDSKLEFSPSWHVVLQRLVNHLCQPWWKRMWTLQEAVLAPKATVMCGAFLEPLETCLRAAFMFKRHYSRPPCCIK